MMKRNKLYTANKWNKPLFATGIDRERQNIFDGLNGSYLSNPFAGGLAGQSYQTPQLASPTVAKPVDWSNGYQRNMAITDSGNTVDNWRVGALGNNPFGISTKMHKSIPLSEDLKGVAGAIGSVVGGIANRAISGGLNSGVGNAVSGIGSTVGSALSTVNPLLGGAVSAASGIIGGGINALWGTKVNQKKLDAANAGTDYLSNFKSDAATFDDIQGPDAVAKVQNAYSGGLFKKGWARKKNAALRAERNTAESWANRSVDNNIDNIAGTQMDTMLANYSAFGGPLGGSDNTGAIDYGFMSDYLVAKNKAADNKNKVTGTVFDNMPSSQGIFALGGDMQTNGADFTDGLTMIDAGGSHEENPYQGVQVGISRDNGQPNLVEEGETIFDDYVFSKRIKADKETKAKFHVGKKTDISYADLSKKLEKESLERPNDPISQNGLRKQLHDLADEQERQKGEMKEKEMQDAFDRLPPEQQQEIMRQVAMEQQPQEGQQPEEVQQDEEQQAQQQGSEELMQQEQQPQEEEEGIEQINACGGKMNRFDKGGDMKRAIYGLLDKVYTDSDFAKWAKENKVDAITDWENVLKNEQLMAAIAKANPAVADVIKRGYDFGAYKPSKNKGLTFDFKHGGWGLEDYNAWNGSTDAAWQEAVKKGLVKKGMNSEEIGKALSQTDAYKKGSDWLKADEGNRLAYLQLILNSEDAPKAARDYAARYVDKNGWKKDAKRDYQTIFEDPNGTGVRNTHPGTYWKTPIEMLRDKKNMNLVVNDDGTVEEIVGDVPKGWNGVGSYTWQDDKNDYSYNYYKRKSSDSSDTGSSSDAKKKDAKYVPIHNPTWGRYAGLFGPVAGLGLQAMGVGKPDYSKVDASLDIANGSPAMAHYQPIGNYLDYKPMDIWYEQNRMNANSRATDRAIMNNATPVGTKMAGLLANGYNSQTASGDLYRKALEYNDAQKQRVAEFNRGTDMFNAQAANQASATNAQIANNNRQLRAQMAMEAARQRMAADAAWNQGIYGNVQGIFKGLSDWGKENAQHNMIADMAADGLFGTMSDKQNIGRTYIEQKACGGKIKRKKKKGLTF